MRSRCLKLQPLELVQALVCPWEAMELLCALFSHILVQKGDSTCHSVLVWLSWMTYAQFLEHCQPGIVQQIWTTVIYKNKCFKLLGVSYWGSLAHNHSTTKTTSMIPCFSEDTCYILASASVLSRLYTHEDSFCCGSWSNSRAQSLGL